MNPEPHASNPVAVNPASAAEPAAKPPSPGPESPAPPSRGPLAPSGGPPRRPEATRRPAMGCLFTVSILLNIGAGLVLMIVCCGAIFTWGFGGSTGDGVLTEKFVSGKESAKEKVAVIHLDGVIMEGSLGYVQKQIEQAAKDKHVKAIVLRINSPGGSITASDDLHRKVTELVKPSKAKKYDPKTLVVSMGAMAASGGYYVAMPGEVIYAESTTMTGSIGVYAAFPNIEKMGKQYGFSMETIKAGDIKDSGSPFKEMNPHERQVWQEMIDEAYDQFLTVVSDGRKDLTREKLLEKTHEVKGGDWFSPPYKRNLADGGVWTASKAKELKLIDKIGTLEDAIQEAHDLAKMSSEFKAIQYEKPQTLRDMVLGVQSNKPIGLNSPLLDPARLRNALTPRVWYLAPGCEFAGMLAAVESE